MRLPVRRLPGPVRATLHQRRPTRRVPGGQRRGHGLTTLKPDPDPNPNPNPNPNPSPNPNQVGMDFGNAWYNDHHFHYGYYIYAYAVLAA